MNKSNIITNIYVDQQNGNDWHSGTTDNCSVDSGPVKTLEKALDYVDDLRTGNCMQPITIKIMGDEYILDKEIIINNDYITIESYAEKKVKIKGAKRIDGFEKSSFNGIDCIAAKLPDGVICSDVFVNGKRAMLPRYPESGYLYPTDTESKTKQLDDRAEWFVAEKGVFENISHIDEVTVNFNHYWVDEHSGIENYDRNTGKVTMKKTTAFTIFSSRKGSETAENSNAEFSTMEYYLENVREMFKKPNQYFIDNGTNTLYYIPDNKNDIECYMPTVGKMFEVKGRNVNFRNIVFEYSSSEYESECLDERTQKKLANDPQGMSGAYGLINYNHSSGSAVQNCEFKHFGLYGITVNQGCHNINIESSLFTDCGAGGIKIEGDNDPESDINDTFGNTIKNNTITYCGIKYNSACGILLIHSYENNISHNEIAYTYYTGISCGWVWGYIFSKSYDNIIEKNHIHHIGQGKLSDMGGIYILGPQKGTVLRGNLIHDTRCRYYGGQAIYLDEGSSYVTVENNICYNVDAGSLQQHFGFMNIVKNNIFDAGEHGCTLHWRQEMHTGFVAERNILFTRNGMPVYGSSGEEVLVDCFSSDYNLIYAYDDDEPVFYKQYGINKKHNDAMCEHELDTHSIISDPGFEDIDNFNFKLKPSSPAYAIGFKDIDISDVGPKRRN